ncbi:MAG: SH3 domain-containing protein [bacterium]|nr:SH3 domain-containing protein [bacterium]
MVKMSKWLISLITLTLIAGCITQYSGTKKPYSSRVKMAKPAQPEILQHVFYIVIPPKGTISSRKKVLVTVYKSYSIQSGELMKVAEGTHVRGLEKRGDWYRIQLPDGKTEGWMQGYYLEKE